MGNIKVTIILHMSRNNVVSGLKIYPVRLVSQICESCITGKMTRVVIHKASETRAIGIFEVVHTDLDSPMEYYRRGELVIL